MPPVGGGSPPVCGDVVLVLICGWGYFANLHLSLLEGSEGLTPHTAGEMGRRNEFFDLTYHGEPYFNKPPLFFWLLHWATSLGDQGNRVADSGLACGDRHGGALVYVLGTRLLSRRQDSGRRSSWATSHVFLWYGRRAV